MATLATIPANAEVIDALMRETFNAGRAPRSAPYKHGVRFVLEFKLDGVAFRDLPYPEGTAESDAFFAGQTEGWEIYKRLLKAGRAC
jgi:hypothetical protein